MWKLCVGAITAYCCLPFCLFHVLSTILLHFRRLLTKRCICCVCFHDGERIVSSLFDLFLPAIPPHPPYHPSSDTILPPGLSLFFFAASHETCTHFISTSSLVSPSLPLPPLCIRICQFHVLFSFFAILLLISAALPK